MDIKKHIMRLRKYVFCNLSTLWSYIFTWYIIQYKVTHFSPCPPEAPICSKDRYLTNLILFSCILLCLFLLGFLEVLVRKLTKKFIIERYFPDFKLNINIKIPKFIVIPYNILFFAGFFLGCIYVLGISLFIAIVLLISVCVG